LPTFGTHSATGKSYWNVHDLKEWIKKYFHIAWIHLRKILYDLLLFQLVVNYVRSEWLP
jgi:hypothetical protein